LLIHDERIPDQVPEINDNSKAAFRRKNLRSLGVFVAVLSILSIKSTPSIKLQIIFMGSILEYFTYIILHRAAIKL